MSPLWTSAALWLAQISVVASCLILLTLLLTRLTRQPARRQRLGEVGLAAALLATALSLAPAWLVIGLPLKAQETTPAESVSMPEELIDLRPDPETLVMDDRPAALPPAGPAEADFQNPAADPPKISLGTAIALGLLALYGGGMSFF